MSLHLQKPKEPFLRQPGTTTIRFCRNSEERLLPFHHLSQASLNSARTEIQIQFEKITLTLQGAHLLPLWEALARGELAKVEVGNVIPETDRSLRVDQITWNENDPD